MRPLTRWVAVMTVAVCSLPLFGSTAATSAGQATTSFSAWGTPTIDGVIGQAEWASANSVAFAANLPGGGTTPARFYVMNDKSNLYFGLRIERPELDNSSFEVVFDNDHDGIAEVGDDVFVVNAWAGFFDDYRQGVALNGIEDWRGGGTTDGGQAVSNDGSFSYYEVWHPLDSADTSHDVSLALGDTVGFYADMRICSTSCADTMMVGAWSPYPGQFVDLTVAARAPLLVQGAGIVVQHRLLGSFSVNLSYDGLTAIGAMTFMLPVSYQGGNGYLTASSTSPRFVDVACRAGKPVSATFSGDGSFVLRSPSGAVLLSGAGYIKATLGEGRTGTVYGYVAPTGPPFTPEISFPNATFIGHLDITNDECPT